MFVKMLIDNGHVVCHDMCEHTLARGLQHVAYRGITRQAVLEEALGGQVVDNVHIIVEIYELLTQPFYAMQVQLDRIYIEYR